MPAVTDIGTLLDRDPKIRHGRPKIAGTGITVHRIAIYYQMGFTPEEISRKKGYITPAQVHAALAYYLSNREEIDAEIAAEEAEEEAIFAQNRRIPEPNR